MTAADWGVEVRTAEGVWRVDHGQTLTIGRDDTAGVRIVGPLISRSHAVIESTADGFQLRDLSRNGIYVNGTRQPVIGIVAPMTVNLGAADGPAVQLAPTAYAAPAPTAPPAAPPAAATGPDRGLTGRVTVIHEPQRAVVRVGRAEENDITLDDLLVSRYHAELRASGSGFEIVDLGSHNGTFVNGVAVDSAPVGPGDIISIGSSLFRLRNGRLEGFSDLGGAGLVARDIRVVTDSGLVLVNDVTFALDGASFLGVVGPSGSGKSTLLRALSGGQPADAGAVYFDGRDVYAEFAALRARIGMVPQDDIVQLDLTVGASLSYAAELRFPPDVSRAERKARVEEVMAQLGLSHRRDTVINSLSGGQRKRVSVATELLTRPALLFLDEPTSGLDPGLERSLMQTLRELADGGRTVVCVTHSVESLQLCDRVLFLAPGGHVAYFGPPSRATTYFERPDLQTVFQALSAETGWTERFERSPVHEEFVARPLAAYTAPAAPPADARAVRTKGWARQFSTFSRRYARSLVADRRNLLILLAAAPLLGLVFFLRFPTDQLTPVDPDQGPRLFSQASAPLMILALAMTQLGINLSAREIVRELPLFRRERAVGLSITAYVASKFAVLAGIGALQALVCVAFALGRQGGPDEGAVLASGRAELVIVFFLTWLAGMTLGLLCSALAASEQRLTLVLPALIGLQTLAVTGTAIASIPSVPVLDQTEYVASASWEFTAAASTVQLNQLNAFNSAIGEVDIEAARKDPRGAVANALNQIESRDPNKLESLGNPDFNHDARAWWRAVLVLIALTFGALAGTVIALRRYDPL